MTTDKENLTNTTDLPAAEPNTPDSNQEHMIPKSRLDEEIGKRKDLESRLAAIEKANREAEEQRLKDQENWRELAEKRLEEVESLKPKASVADEQEKTLQAFLASQIEELPEDMHSLIPDQLSTMQKLTWLSANKAKLLKPLAPDIGAGAKGAGGSGKTAVQLTAEEQEIAHRFGMSAEEYAKHKDA